MWQSVPYSFYLTMEIETENYLLWNSVFPESWCTALHDVIILYVCHKQEFIIDILHWQQVTSCDKYIYSYKWNLLLATLYYGKEKGSWLNNNSYIINYCRTS